ncbi:MAG: hypothetical protein JW840_02470 [Candidatus Thermoplasmatota archaeon]|nr:hypothetical protein [Candidatus Thermoplasmatota archaeon]
MSVRDKVFSWYLNNVLIPRMEEINYPGYVFADFAKCGKSNLLRELFLPESLFVNLERNIIRRFGTKGRELLYRIGKTFGYVNASLSQLPTIREVSKKDFLDQSYFLVRYIEGTWASNLTHTVNYNERVFRIDMKDYIVCPANGFGYLFSTGGIGGIWAFVCNDPNMEAVQTKCQGKGNDNCQVISADYKTLVDMGYHPLKTCVNEKVFLGREYSKFNRIRTTEWAKLSLRSLIDSGFFRYNHGQVEYRKERFFLCEASFMYILERELKKTKGAMDILWDTSFEFGKTLAEIAEAGDAQQFIMEFLPVLGFGDILCNRNGGKHEIYVKYFPWMRLAGSEIDFLMFRGMLSGIISQIEGRKIELKKIEKDVSKGYLSLFISS